jgi:hypothetical protein
VVGADGVLLEGGRVVLALDIMASVNGFGRSNVYVTVIQSVTRT